MPELGRRVQTKFGGHFGTLVVVDQDHSFTVRYDPTYDDRGRKIRGQKVYYPWHRNDSFNFL